MFILGFFSFFCGYGCVGLQAGLMSEILKIYGYSDQDSSVLAAIVLVAGLGFTIVYGICKFSFRVNDFELALDWVAVSPILFIFYKNHFDYILVFEMS